MALVYEDNEPRRSGRPVSYDAMPATRLWHQHFSNACYLRFIAENPESRFAERAQANRELETAERKMTYWRRHPNFDAVAAGAMAEETKRQWSGER